MSRGVLTPAEAADVIRRLSPGQSFIYFLGDLAWERDQAKSSLGRRRPSQRANDVRVLAEFMVAQATTTDFLRSDFTQARGFGNGQLTQRRLGQQTFAYIFTKSGSGKCTQK